MQSSSRSRFFNPTLAGASPATDASLKTRNPNNEIRKIDEDRNPNRRPADRFDIQNSGFFRISSFDIRHLQRNQGVISSARRSAKVEVRGANPRESTNQKPEDRIPRPERITKLEIRNHSEWQVRHSSFGLLSDFGFRVSDFSTPLCLSSNRASFVNSYSSVRLRPGAPLPVMESWSFALLG